MDDADSLSVLLGNEHVLSNREVTDVVDATLLLLLNRVEFVDLVFKPFNALATKLSRVIVREKIMECFVAQQADNFYRYGLIGVFPVRKDNSIANLDCLAFFII